MEQILDADIAVVGAGAAGLMTAIWAARASQGKKYRILLFDTRKKIGAKILISGGTRCNVTHVRVSASDYHGGSRHFIQHVFEAFTPAETIRFFEEIGVKLVLEETGKYFPVTHSGKTVLDALLKETGRLGIGLETGVRISEIKKVGDVFECSGDPAGRHYGTRRVILTTGGLSYPETGSDGTGFKIAKDFGHTIVETAPALTPLLTDDPDWPSLSGVSLEAQLSFFLGGRKRGEVTGAFLFTHFGFSGPAALDVSRYFSRAKFKENPFIEAKFLLDCTEEHLKEICVAARKNHPRKLLINYLNEKFILPERFWGVCFKKINLDENTVLRHLSGAAIKNLAGFLLHYRLPVTGVVGYKKAEVTSGGVDLAEVRVSTMESRRVPGLYFAGEILDADGRIGGFNFQWAWSTGALAGKSAVKSL